MTSFFCLVLLVASVLSLFMSAVHSEPFVLPPMRSNQKPQRAYDKVDYYEFDNFADFESDFLMTVVEGDREYKVFRTNMFIGLASSNECYERDLSSPALRGTQRLAGGSVLAVGLMKTDIFPVKMSEGVCSEVLFYRLGTSIEMPEGRNSNFDHVEMTRWSTDFTRVNFKFINKFPYKIDYVWHEESHDEMEQGSLKTNEAVSISSFLGHIFSAYKFRLKLNDKMNSGPRQLVDFMTVNGEDYEFHPSNRLESCEVSHLQGVGGGDFVDEEHLTCDNLDMRFVEFSNQVWHVKRVGLNYVQPKLVPPVTDAGFELRKLPIKTYTWLREWYLKQRELDEIDENAVGPCMNQHVAPTGITHITPELKERLSSELQEILEAWYEKGPLTMTSIYGVRRYINNSILRMHVDTVNTHVVSAIINVDQGGMEKDWPLLILDHDGNEHNVSMQPGDMVLYESAKLLHGRPEVMKGEHYDNIFIHYMPVTGWDYSWI